MSTWKVGASRTLPLARRDSWDGQAAKDSIFKAAGWPDNPDPAMARKAFLVYDADAPELKGSYKLPFAMAVGGTLTAIDTGITACSQRLSATDIPESVMSSCMAVIEHYKKRFENYSEGRTTSLKFAFPARILHRQLDPANLLAIAKATRAFDPTIFDEVAPFFWLSEMSNNRLDSYFTRMDESSLRNYAADAQAGIAFQDSHDTCRMSLGRSLAGRMEQAPGGELRVTADFFTLPGIRFNGGSYQSSDDFVRSVRAGIASDNSIGFYFENTDPNVFAGFRCDVCGEDLMDWGACRHIPGMMYEKIHDNGQTERMIATATIMNAHASECSIVYDGATPGAAIIKAQMESEAGRLQPKAARFLEQRYRSVGLKLPDARSTYAVGTIREEDDMVDKDKVEQPDDRAAAGNEPARHQKDVELENNLRKMITEAGFAEGMEIPTALRNLVDEVKQLRAANAGIPDLQAKAKDGEAYRKALIEDAIKAGKRAVGEGYDEAQYRTILEGLPLDAIKRMTGDWNATGDKRFPGGRQTTEGEEGGEEGKREKPAVPAQAFIS